MSGVLDVLGNGRKQHSAQELLSKDVANQGAWFHWNLKQNVNIWSCTTLLHAGLGKITCQLVCLFHRWTCILTTAVKKLMDKDTQLTPVASAGHGNAVHCCMLLLLPYLASHLADKTSTILSNYGST